MAQIVTKSVAIIVAHPDDETLWAGGTILSHPTWKCFVVCLCRKNDPDRATRFYNALRILKCEGVMGDLDDGPDQKPLNEMKVGKAILRLLPNIHFDLIITHSSSGEYSRHLRHEEVGKAVIKLWHDGKIATSELWNFAYEDGNKEYFPRPVENAPGYHKLTEQIWNRKYNIMSKTYGFNQNSWEAQTTPRAESFWQFTSPNQFNN